MATDQRGLEKGQATYHEWKLRGRLFTSGLHLFLLFDFGLLLGVVDGQILDALGNIVDGWSDWFSGHCELGVNVGCKYGWNESAKKSPERGGFRGTGGYKAEGMRETSRQKRKKQTTEAKKHAKPGNGKQGRFFY